MENTDSPESAAASLVPLDDAQARILGCLVEKAAITPEAYPLTLNALVAACNQKTSREPVMNLEPGAVGHALNELERRGLVKIAPASQRALRYEHRFDPVYGTTARQRAVLCALLLRGPQTLNELHTRTERLAEFPSVDDLRDTLDRLIQREPACVVRLGRGAGQREDRYMHLLAGPVDVEALASAPPPAASARGGAHERIEQLEAEVAQLREELARLRDRLDAAGV
ncbi:YceH family protein [Dokdonella ginsengisoli]|uniref:YceH family protein n=1 Tax=Dokdonella ginsengisoli TaxID=363846 RepID=A0ABV9QS94_9GAMM